MFFILSKLLAFFIFPLHWIFFFLFGALFFKHEKWKKRSLRAAVIGLIFFTNPLIINQLYLAYETPPISPSALRDTFEIGILLGGYSNFHTETPEDLQPFSASASRFTQAFELYKTGKIRKILLSGGAGELFGKATNEAERMHAFLIRLGVPEQDILIENQSRSTRENAVFCKKFIETHYQTPPTYLLLTSAWHLPRASGCFEKTGLRCTNFPVDFWGKPFQWRSSLTFVPDHEAFLKWDTIIKEWIGLVAYKINGFI